MLDHGVQGSGPLASGAWHGGAQPVRNGGMRPAVRIWGRRRDDGQDHPAREQCGDPIL